MEDSCQRDLLSHVEGMILHPAGVMEDVGVAPEGAQLIASGLTTEVVETISNLELLNAEETVWPEVETLHFMV